MVGFPLIMNAVLQDEVRLSPDLKPPHTHTHTHTKTKPPIFQRPKLQRNGRGTDFGRGPNQPYTDENATGRKDKES